MCKTIKLFTITKIRAWVFHYVSKDKSVMAGFPLGGWVEGGEEHSVCTNISPSKISLNIPLFAKLNLTFNFNFG